MSKKDDKVSSLVFAVQLIFLLMGVILFGMACVIALFRFIRC